MFRHDILGVHFGSLVLCDVGQNLASVTQRLAIYSSGRAPQEGSDPTQETSEKITNVMPTL